jgi:hypothetical protein
VSTADLTSSWPHLASARICAQEKLVDAIDRGLRYPIPHLIEVPFELRNIVIKASVVSQFEFGGRLSAAEPRLSTEKAATSHRVRRCTLWPPNPL